MTRRLGTATAAAAAVAAALLVSLAAGERDVEAGDPVVATIYRAERSRGLMVTSGGWAYCEQLRSLAKRTRYTLVCGRYAYDEYTGPGLRSRRHLDWGNPRYLARFARIIRDLRRTARGSLVLTGVSYSGFGVATLASHHPELRPDRLIVIDSYLDLVARRRRLPDRHITAREIDRETGGSETELRRRSVDVDGLAQLVRAGTRFAAVWTVSEHERRFFNGATCGRDATAATLLRLARRLGRAVPAWVTRTRHGHNLWNHGVEIVRGDYPGRKVVFRPGGDIPRGAVCGP